MRRIKILHVLTSPRAEGTPGLVLDWLNSDLPIVQHILFLRPGIKEELDRFEKSSSNISIIEDPGSGLQRIWRIISWVKNITAVFKPDIVIAWTTGQSQYIHTGAWLGGARKLILHAGNPPSISGFLPRYIFSWITFWTAMILRAQVACCSDYVKRVFLEIAFMPNKNFHKIYNCFNPERFIREGKTSSDHKSAIMVATLESHKDHETLFHAWSYVEKEKKGYQLLLAGDGSLRKHLEERATAFQLQTSDFLGSRNDIPSLLHESSVFILSTTEAEGFGTVLLEALSSGLPVVATDVPACREVLHNGEYGTLIPQKDPKALADAILKAFENTLTDEQRMKNITYASSFTPERMIKDYLKLVNIDISLE